jgi:hypothetical protein
VDFLEDANISEEHASILRAEVRYNPDDDHRHVEMSILIFSVERPLDLQADTSVSEKFATSIFRVEVHYSP